jgi:ABC-type multidrug transport system permease subunit
MWEHSVGEKEHPVREFIQHLVTAAIVVGAVFFLDWVLSGQRYVWWLAGIWAVILVLHGFQVLVSHVWPRESSEASPAGDPEGRDDRNR